LPFYINRLSPSASKRGHQAALPYALNAVSQAEKFLGEFEFPAVIKPNCGGSGVGIQKFFAPNQLREAIAMKTIQMPWEQLVLLQQFIQREEPTISLAATTPGYCPAVPAENVPFELYENPPLEVIRAVEKIVEVAGLECGGIEQTPPRMVYTSRQ